jgi:hypothetical protein
MSHFDDIDFIGWIDSPRSALGAAVLMVAVGAAIWWAISADAASRQTCADHGEAYVDSREVYTLCEQDGGTVVRR